MLERQKFELGQDEETLRRVEQTRFSHLGSIVEIDGIELDRLLELAADPNRQDESTLSEAQQIRLSNLGPLVAIDGLVLDRLLELAAETVRNREDALEEDELFARIDEAEDIA